MERSSFLQFVGDLYQRQLYPGPVIFTATSPALPLRADLCVTGKQLGVSAEVKVSDPVAMTTRNAQEFQRLARISERGLRSKLSYPDQLEHIALDQPGFDVILFGEGYYRAHKLGVFE